MHIARRHPPPARVHVASRFFSFFPLNFRQQETTYTYSPPFERAGRASHVDDVRAGSSQWDGGLGEVLSGTIGLRVVQILPIRPHRPTRLLRLGGAVSAVARQRGGLARSSSARRLARVAEHRPQPPGLRVASVSRGVEHVKPYVYKTPPIKATQTYQLDASTDVRLTAIVPHRPEPSRSVK